ncbi:UNVERIFIED_CONTAM: hypothetical protein HDU68_006740 [Siphonaria sp. JEL0065]|nr:hypothetical protein HDU68_006740 [Siphonaria sp. JEL0065]
MVAALNNVYLGIYTHGSAVPKYTLIESPMVSMGERIKQIDGLEKFDLFLVLVEEGTLFSYSLKAILSNNRNQSSVRHKIVSHVPFFRIGVCDDKTLICAVGDTGGLRWQLLDPARKKSFFLVIVKRCKSTRIFSSQRQ